MKKTSEWNLREAYEIINRSPAIAFLWRKDEGWPVEFVSENVLTLCGYSADEFLTGAVSYVDLIHPDDLDRVGTEVEEADRDQQLDTFQHSPYRIITRDGEIKWVEDNSSLKRDPTGEVTHYRSILLDITDRKRDEEILRRSKQHWENTFDAIPALITLQDRDMRIIRTNRSAAEFFGMEFREMIGKHCYELFRDTDHPCAECPSLDTLSDGSSHTRVIEQKRLGRIFQVTSSPVLDDNGEVSRLVHTARDVTEQKRLEEQLRQTHKLDAIGTLAGGIAHDFNNLLMVILGSAEIVRLGMKTGVDLEENLDQIVTAGKRAARLVQQLLDFSRNTEHESQPFEPYLVVKEAMKMLRASVPATVTIKTDIDENSGTVEADPARISQMVIELCTNSLHAMAEQKGSLSVELRRQHLRAEEIVEQDVTPGPFIVLTIRDTGSGMDEDIRQHVFDPYYTTREVGSGSGLGLAVIHSIVRDYHGMIRMESSPGVGTTISVYIPALEDEEVPEHCMVEEVPGCGRLLLVDDENGIVSMAKSALENYGYQVTGITDSRKAWTLFAEDPERFDLLLTDQTMPVMTGTELAEKVLALRPELPIVLCTGYSALVSRDDALRLGIRRFVSKPIVGSELARIVGELLADSSS